MEVTQCSKREKRETCFVVKRLREIQACKYAATCFLYGRVSLFWVQIRISFSCAQKDDADEDLSQCLEGAILHVKDGAQ